MSFQDNPGQQISFEDRYLALPAQVQKIVDRSWARDFAEIVFPCIDEKRFSVLYDQGKGTSNSPINVTVGGLMLKDQFGFSDADLVEAMYCDIRFQYALHTTSYKEQPVSERTFQRFRERIYDYELQTGRQLFTEEMESLAEPYARFLNLHPNLKKVNSSLIAESARAMSRLETLYKSNADAVKLLESKNIPIPKSLVHYLESGDSGKIIDVRDSEAATRCRQEERAALRLLKLLKKKKMDGSFSYQLLSQLTADLTE